MGLLIEKLVWFIRFMKWVLGLGVCLFSIQIFAAERVLLVGQGGWESCRNGLENQFIAVQFGNLVDNLKRNFPGKRFATLTTCTKFLAAVGSTPIPYRYTDEWGRVTCGDVAANGVSALVASYTTSDTAVFLLGHSHGGWLAMNATAGLKQVWGLFTIEPVSAAQCDVRDFLRNRSKRPVKRRQIAISGCRNAPTDVNTRALLGSVRSNWFNYVLNPNQFRGDAHSSMATGARNVLFTVNGGKDSHHLLGLDYRVWTDICIRASHILGEARPFCAAIEVNYDGQLVRRR